MSGNFVYNVDWSSLEWTGQPITNKFQTTVDNQQIILFKRENNRVLVCPSLTVTAGNSDIYLTVIKGNAYLDGGVVKDLDGSDYDFANNPVFFIEANSTININGLDATGVRFANNLGCEYLIQAIGFFSNDKFEGDSLDYNRIREESIGTEMRVSYSSAKYVSLRERADHTSKALTRINNGEIIPVLDLVLGTYVNKTYFWALVEYDGKTGFVNYNCLKPYVQ